MERKAVIQLRNVAKSFGNQVVLHDVNLDVIKGESLVILGSSGSGKSVMLKCILGLVPINAGSIRVNGIDLIRFYSGSSLSLATSSQFLKGASGAGERISMLFQGLALFDSLLVWENIAFALLQQGILSRPRARSFSLGKLSRVGLTADVADRYPHELSGGMQRRVALARTIAFDPSIIFFDEPTSGLDPTVSSTIDDLILSCVKELGATTITVTHDMASVRRMADRIAMLKDGKIIWQAGTERIFDQDFQPASRSLYERL